MCIGHVRKIYLGDPVLYKPHYRFMADLSIPVLLFQGL